MSNHNSTSAAAASGGSVENYHPLNNSWTFYAHLPHDTDWSITSYRKILDIKYAEELISVMETLSDKMIQNCMLFMMANGVKPIWEDEKNRQGGSFSFKLSNDEVVHLWKDLIYKTLGHTITDELSVYNKINGITISPKRNFCIVKIWMSDCSVKNIDFLRDSFRTLYDKTAIFKKHNPEY